ncbi:MAG: TlpA family protein disulfide reductase [Deltaproteobacteria bacterium]|nr:TlpA family protein disulfide reductase [Deltaproteobacteria bacterium]
MNTGETTAASPGAVRLDLGLRLSDGRWLELADLRGTPVMLFVFATFDAVSQASLKSLRPFVPQHPEVLVVGVAAQPRALQLVEAWAYALDPPFVVGADPYGRVENGESMLGKIEAVPTYILYDARGYEISRTTGLLSEGDLAKLVQPLSRGAD